MEVVNDNVAHHIPADVVDEMMLAVMGLPLTSKNMFVNEAVLRGANGFAKSCKAAYDAFYRTPTSVTVDSGARIPLDRFESLAKLRVGYFHGVADYIPGRTIPSPHALPLSLRSLSLGTSCAVTGSQLKVMCSQCPRLLCLTLTGSSLDGEELRDAVAGVVLEELTLRACWNVHSQALCSIIDSLRGSLEVLDIQDISIDDSVFRSVAGTHRVKYLQLGSCLDASALGARCLLDSQIDLTCLRLVDFVELDRDLIVELAQKWPELERLGLPHTPMLDRHCLSRIRGLSKLVHLDVQGCDLISARHGRRLAYKMPALKRVSFSGWSIGTTPRNVYDFLHG